jgi:hypothetical protein
MITGTRANLQIRIRGGWNLNQGASVAVVGKYALQGCAAPRAHGLSPDRSGLAFSGVDALVYTNTL